MKNESGIDPVGFRVIMKPDVVDETTAGGIIMPQQKVIHESLKQQLGTLVALGDNAFVAADWTDAEREKLVPGARVMMTKYGGVLFRNKVDGVRTDFFMCNDGDITGILTEEVEFG